MHKTKIAWLTESVLKLYYLRLVEICLQFIKAVGQRERARHTARFVLFHLLARLTFICHGNLGIFENLQFDDDLHFQRLLLY